MDIRSMIGAALEDRGSEALPPCRWLYLLVVEIEKRWWICLRSIVVSIMHYSPEIDILNVRFESDCNGLLFCRTWTDW